MQLLRSSPVPSCSPLSWLCLLLMRAPNRSLSNTKFNPSARLLSSAACSQLSISPSPYLTQFLTLYLISNLTIWRPSKQGLKFSRNSNDLSPRKWQVKCLSLHLLRSASSSSHSARHHVHLHVLQTTSCHLHDQYPQWRPHVTCVVSRCHYGVNEMFALLGWTERRLVIVADVSGQPFSPISNHLKMGPIGYT